jgi:hypothetical protein
MTQCGCLIWDLRRVRIDGAHTLSVLGSCREVHGPASPELEPTLETPCLTSEALDIGPFDLSSGGETHGCNSALSYHTQLVLVGKEVGLDVRPMNRLSRRARALAVWAHGPSGCSLLAQPRSFIEKCLIDLC